MYVECETHCHLAERRMSFTHQLDQTVLLAPILRVRMQSLYTRLYIRFGRNAHTKMQVMQAIKPAGVLGKGGV